MLLDFWNETHPCSPENYASTAYLAKLLLERGADPNKPARGLNWVSSVPSATLLCYPAEEGDVELVDLFIQYGVDVNASPGGSPLPSAAIPKVPRVGSGRRKRSLAPLLSVRIKTMLKPDGIQACLFSLRVILCLSLPSTNNS